MYSITTIRDINRERIKVIHIDQLGIVAMSSSLGKTSFGKDIVDVVRSIR